MFAPRVHFDGCADFDGGGHRTMRAGGVGDIFFEALDGFQEALGRRRELVALGLEHARRFSWAETGRVHLQSYADAL